MAVVGRPAAAYSHGAACGGNSIHWSRIQHQSVFYGSMFSTVIKCRQAGPMSGLFLLDVYVKTTEIVVVYTHRE